MVVRVRATLRSRHSQAGCRCDRLLCSVIDGSKDVAYHHSTRVRFVWFNSWNASAPASVLPVAAVTAMSAAAAAVAVMAAAAAVLAVAVAAERRHAADIAQVIGAAGNFG